MKAVIVIPARFSSTRLIGKPLKDIKGKPMIQRVYEGAKGAKLADDVVVATDDERILKTVKAFGGNAVMTSSSCRTGSERVAEAAKDLSADIVVNVQGDEPLIEPSVIDDCVRVMMDDKDVLISTPASRVKTLEEFNNLNVVKVVTDKKGFALYFSRSPIPSGGVEGAKKHIGLYVYRRDVLLKLAKMDETFLEKSERLEQLRAMENGFKIKVVMTSYDPLSVDTPEDLEKVRRIVG